MSLDEIISAPCESEIEKPGSRPAFCFDASAPVRTPRISGDVAPAAGSIRLQVRLPLVTDNRRGAGSRLDAGLDLEATSHSLVVLGLHDASLDAALDLQAARDCLVMVGRQCHTTSFDSCLHLQTMRHRLVMIGTSSACFDARFDFH